MISSTQQQQATGKLDSLSRETDRLSKEEHAQADRIRSMTGQSGASNQEQYEARLQQRNKLAEDRQQLSDDLSSLEKNMRNAARELAPSQPQAASKLRDALGGMDQTDLTNRRSGLPTGSAGGSTPTPTERKKASARVSTS